MHFNVGLISFSALCKSNVNLTQIAAKTMLPVTALRPRQLLVAITMRKLHLLLTKVVVKCGINEQTC